MKRITIAIAFFTLTAASFAATPPDRMHYQGVLRDAAGDPLDGSYDMVFALFSAETLGDEILVDRHLAANGQAVGVSGGMLSAHLGTGQVADGSGPGTYTSLMEVFAGHGDVWLEIRIGAETLSPRLHVAASGYALNAGRFDGRPSTDFVDTSTVEQIKEGKLVVGNASGTAGAHGIEAFGSDAGAYFADREDSGYAYVGSGDTGIQGFGDFAGGYFENGTNEVYLAQGAVGVSGVGDAQGGYFRDTANTCYAQVGDSGEGIEAKGFTRGGAFYDWNDSGHAYVGYGDRGIEAFGTNAGGYFKDSNSSGYAYAGFGNYGVQGFGTTAGGYFKDDNSSGYAFVGYGNRGIHGFGTAGGGYFADTDSSGYAYIGSGTYKILGSGSVSFVQNHPDDASKVVVYHAPESSEVGVYTRGSARLRDGVARIELDETFAWVTNPDVGLTAHLTPKTDGAALFVAALTTEILTVRAQTGAAPDAAFDYMVWGLRIGFEDSTPVQPKQQEAYIPSMKMHEDLLRNDPGLARFTAAARFEAIERETFEAEKHDRTAAEALLRKIHVFDAAVDRVDIAPVAFEEPEAAAATRAPDVQIQEDLGSSTPERPSNVTTDTGATESGTLPDRLPVAEPVSATDLLIVNEAGEIVVAFGEADRGVLGVATEDDVTVDGQRLVRVATSGVIRLKVDADLGAIRRGDLLISSPTPGHAMRAYASIPGTVIAKALEPLEAGKGAIRVLITPR